MSRPTLKYLAKRILRSPIATGLRFRLDRRLGRLSGDALARQRFSIGLLGGADPLDLACLSGVSNPVLTAAMVSDADASFVADPFLLERGGRWYLFFEVWNSHAHKGEIALATSDDARKWWYTGIIHREPFHLSYPLVFAEGSEVFMLPESHAAGEVRLYRAAEFPVRWRLDAILLKGCFCDATVFRHDGLWWMFAMQGCSPGGGPLDLFWSQRLTAGWQRHPCSPIPADPATHSRPAGRVLQRGSRLTRFAQSARPWYGTSVFAFDIVELTTSNYREVPSCRGGRPLLTGSGCGWNRHGMHHLDLVPTGEGWIAAVDGWVGGLGEHWDGADRECFLR